MSSTGADRAAITESEPFDVVEEMHAEGIRH